MSLLSYKEWLSKIAPDGAGESWSNRSNADLRYGKYLRSKRTKIDDNNKSGQAELDPEKLYLGKTSKQDSDIGDINGI